MVEHIVIGLRSGQSLSEARKKLKELPQWAVLEPQFHGLPTLQAGEQAILSEMRRTLRFACPPEVDIEELVRRLRDNHLVEFAYRKPPAEPA